MTFTLEEAAAYSGLSVRQIRYLIQTKRLRAEKRAGRWWIESADLPKSDGQKRARARKQRQAKAAVEGALGLDPEAPDDEKTYSVRDLAGFQIGVSLHSAVVASFGADHPAAQALKRVLIDTARGYHRYSYGGKARSPRIAAFHVDADRNVLRLHRALRAGTYRAGPLDVRLVRDPKLRLVAVADVHDCVVQQALVSEVACYYERSFLDHSYACMRGRGPQRALVRHLAWTRRYRYRLQLDVARFYPSVDHAILLDLFAARLKDAETLALLRYLVTSGSRVYRTPAARYVLGADRLPPPGTGLALGSYLSHWSGDFYLNGLDHFVKRVCKVRGYLRYLDDFVLFSDDAAELEGACDAVAEWLWRQRRLRLKQRGRVMPTAAPATFLGTRVSRSGFRPGRKAKRRMRARVRAAAERGPDRLRRTLMAYRGLFLF